MQKNTAVRRAGPTRRTPPSAVEIVVDTEVGTFGEVVPGLVIESVVDPDHPDRLLLHTWNGRRTTTASKVKTRGRIIRP